MQDAFNPRSPKKPANVSVKSDLLAQAKALKINLSATLELALTDLVNERQREIWKRENTGAIEAYNQLVKEHGTFGHNMNFMQR